MALVGTAHVDSPRYRLDVWTVRHVSGELTPHEGEVAAAQYYSVDEIRALSLVMPSNARVLALLGH